MGRLIIVVDYCIPMNNSKTMNNKLAFPWLCWLCGGLRIYEVNLILLTMGPGDDFVGNVGCWGLKRSQKTKRKRRPV